MGVGAGGQAGLCMGVVHVVGAWVMMMWWGFLNLVLYYLDW